MIESGRRYDVIIVGAGAAGLTAALYAARRTLKTLVITQDIGGQAATTNEIENYPGVDFVTGPDLMGVFQKQCLKYGAEFVFEEVRQIGKREVDEGGKRFPLFTVSTPTQAFESPVAILAFGLTHRHLGVPGEEELGGRGVTYCATCDAPLYKGKVTAVVGGGNSAVDAALLLSKIANEVYLIHRRDSFTAEGVLVDQLKEAGNVELVLNSAVQEIKGQAVSGPLGQRVASVVVHEVNDAAKEREIPVDGVFIEVGYLVNSKLVEGLIELDERKQIKISRDCETSQPGVYAAGDVTTISFKQIVISAGEGATAALKAYQYLQQLKGQRGVVIDWGIRKAIGG